MNKIKFSIIMPLYNKENSVGRTIRSVLAQTVNDFELIIVDDGSKDRSVQIVREIQDERIRLIQQPNGGVSKARNHGIREAKGEYICFIDADDFWTPVFLETVQTLMQEFPTARMFCPSYQVSYGKKMIHPKWRSVDLEKDSLVRDFFEMATAPFWICNSSCVVVEKQILLQMEYWFPEEETVYEDFDLWIRVGVMGEVAHSNNVCATYQRITEKNARKSHTDRIVYSKTYMETLDRLLSDSSYSGKQKGWIREIKDRRMVPYIFSLLLTGNREKARQVLNGWDVSNTYQKYRLMLLVALYTPKCMIDLVQRIRLQVF